MFVCSINWWEIIFVLDGVFLSVVSIYWLVCIFILSSVKIIIVYLRCLSSNKVFSLLVELLILKCYM